ncbi:tripartite tricarboxylate transporter substrate binding protein [Variovorax sp. LjRoot84]|uniref:Bug family tripartite tricarboxylate transporter substrate binding protein n=1 Tax=Variovorax sp. LjRoot84 TaxID=3342340 RepID=UPI003ECE7588
MSFAILRWAGLLAIGLALSTQAAAQKFPSRPITLLAPAAPGGSTDAVCRALADAVSRQLGAPVVVENRPGAGGALATVSLASAKPDGYTAALMPLAVFRIAFMQKTSFDPLRDIAYVVGLGGFVFGVAVPADAPYRTLAELLAYGKSHPGTLSYGHAGIGTTPHLAMEELAMKTGVPLTAVAYKGSIEALGALLGKQVSMMAGTTEFAPHVEAGKLRVLATMGAQRARAFPEVPTLREAGVDIVNESPFGIGVPRGTDPAVVKILHDAFKAALEDPKVLAAFDRYMLPVIYMNSQDYESFARRTVATERAMLGRLGLLRKD